MTSPKENIEHPDLPKRPPSASPSGPSTLTKLLGKFAQAITLSIWRAMRGKPDFLHIADTPFYWRVHVALYVMLKLLTANFDTNDTTPWWVALILTILLSAAFVLSIHLFFTNKSRSTVLAASFLGAFTGWEIVSETILRGIEAFGESSEAVTSTVVVLSSAAMIFSAISIKRRFKAMPTVVRKAGYQPKLEDDFTWSRHD